MSSPRLIRWESLVKEDFDALDRDRCVVLITCSPLEVHGPHLPMGADALQGEGLAEWMLRFLPERHQDRTFLKLPYIYAATDTVAQPGSLYFQPGTTIAVLSDLGRTLAAQGFRDVFVSNFHGSPRHFLAIEKACDNVNRRYGSRMVSLFSLLISRLTEGTSNLDDVLGRIPGIDKANLRGDTHGGLIETSQLLRLHRDWVSPEYKNLPRSTVDMWREGQPKETGLARLHPRRSISLLAGYGSALRYFTEETYSGAPAVASAEIGERILDVLGEKAAEAAAELLDGTIGPDDCHSPVWRLRFLFLNPIMVRLMNRLVGFRNAIA